ncbi:MAG: hypothetical protein AMJ79_08755 [Phycisphaerae bacterium SM23_30]|nr:MAG: hypothetical protein AMJ79_08755 [Phycisphaerae bacterium SM23_30]
MRERRFFVYEQGPDRRTGPPEKKRRPGCSSGIVATGLNREHKSTAAGRRERRCFCFAGVFCRRRRLEIPMRRRTERREGGPQRCCPARRRKIPPRDKRAARCAISRGSFGRTRPVIPGKRSCGRHSLWGRRNREWSGSKGRFALRPARGTDCPGLKGIVTRRRPI